MRIFLVVATFVIMMTFGMPASTHADPITLPTDSSSQYISPPDATGQKSVTLVNPLGNNTCSTNGTCLSKFLTSILDLVIRIGTVIVILMLVYTGFKFVVAQGSDSKITEAKTMLLWTLIGSLVLLGSKAIAIGIEATVRSLGS